MNEVRTFTRDELQEIAKRALEMSNTSHMNSAWERAYIALADAADRLDAMMARTVVEGK